jgi:hypothetical protein
MWESVDENPVYQDLSPTPNQESSTLDANAELSEAEKEREVHRLLQEHEQTHQQANTADRNKEQSNAERHDPTWCSASAVEWPERSCPENRSRQTPSTN